MMMMMMMRCYNVFVWFSKNKHFFFIRYNYIFCLCVCQCWATCYFTTQNNTERYVRLTKQKKTWILQIEIKRIITILPAIIKWIHAWLFLIRFESFFFWFNHLVRNRQTNNIRPNFFSTTWFDIFFFCCRKLLHKWRLLSIYMFLFSH